MLFSQSYTWPASSANWIVYKTYLLGQRQSDVTNFRVTPLTGPGLMNYLQSKQSVYNLGKHKRYLAFTKEDLLPKNIQKAEKLYGSQFCHVI